MRPISEKTYLRIAPAGDDVVEGTRRFFGDGHSDALLNSVRKGIYKAHSIAINGDDKYLVIWHKDAQGRMFINCVIERNNGGNFGELIAGIKQLARENGCMGISANVSREGLLKMVLENNFKAQGVTVHYDF
jgi:hypothetical protein